jgi:hypothetical protein
MSTPEYEIHLNHDRYASLWGGSDSDSESVPFGEDDTEIARLIEEELGPSRRRGRARKVESR